MEESQRLIASAVNLSPRLARWVNQPLTNFRRLRVQPNVTAIRIAPKPSIWNDDRLRRRAYGRDIAISLDVAQKSIDSQRTARRFKSCRMWLSPFPSPPKPV
jgi:hypothetical protein